MQRAQVSAGSKNLQIALGIFRGPLYDVRVRTIAAGTLLFLACSACADDAAWTFVGGAGNFTHNKQIRMVKERVDIQLDNDRSHFHAAFTFRNEGPATKVTMAFPEERHSESKRGAIHDFFTSVDGVGMKVHRRKLPYDMMSGSEYRAVWLKTVSFGRNQTRHVLVDYWAENGDIGDSVSNKYVLKTGATWKGPIGDCVVNIDWSRLRGTSGPIIFLDHGGNADDAGQDAGSARRRTLHFKNIEPNFDVLMNWVNAFGNFELNGEMLDVSGMSRNRLIYVYGSDSDPKVISRFVHEIFGGDIESDESEGDLPPAIGSPFTVGSHKVRVLGDRTVEIDGKTVRLRRSGGTENDYKCIYLRDLVKALGGKFQYVARLDRVRMWVK